MKRFNIQNNNLLNENNNENNENKENIDNENMNNAEIENNENEELEKPVDGGIGCAEIIAGLLDAAAAGGGEGDDGLALEVVGLHEGVDDGGACVPPDGKSHEDYIVVGHVLQLGGDGGTR